MAFRGGTMLILTMMALLEIQICSSEINRGNFPNGFVFGTASSAFQVGATHLLTTINLLCFFFQLQFHATKEKEKEDFFRQKILIIKFLFFVIVYFLCKCVCSFYDYFVLVCFSI